MLNMINKSKFVSNPKVREAVYKVLDLFEGYILYDIELNIYVELKFSEGKLLVIPKE